MTNDACLTWTFKASILIGGLGLALYLGVHLSPLAAYLIAINVGVFLLYRFDKYASLRQGAQRIPNKMMCLLGILGPLGALFGIYLELFPRESHKTGRGYWWLRLIVAVSLLVHLTLLVAYLIVGGEGLLDWAQGLLAGS